MSIHKELKQIIEIVKPRRYLEIGVWRGVNLLRVNCPYRVGIDPSPEINNDFPLRVYRDTSDNVFASSKFKHNETRFDLIFIDGLHEFKQVMRDIENSLRFLAPYGVIVCHDVYPFDFLDKYEDLTNKEYPGSVPWTGDVWKVILYVKYCVRYLDFCTISSFPGYLCLWRNTMLRRDQSTMSINDINSLTINEGIKQIPLMNVCTIDEFKDDIK